MSMSLEEKRKAIRIPVSLETRFLKDDEEFQGVTLNLSLGGLLLKAAHRLPENDSCVLLFELPRTKQLLKIRSRVVWSSLAESPFMPASCMGLQFEHLAAKHKEQLSQFIERLLEA